MHVIAAKPLYLDASSIAPEALQQQTARLAEQARLIFCWALEPAALRG